MDVKNVFVSITDWDKIEAQVKKNLDKKNIQISNNKKSNKKNK